MNLPTPLLDTFSFSRFTVCLHRREILADSVPIELGSRSFDILITLIEAGGATVSKHELMDRVWPKRIVEENNLHACISRLRKLMGGDGNLIRTVAGRGYRFVGVIQGGGGMRLAAANNAFPGSAGQVGQTELLAHLGRLMLEGRLVCAFGNAPAGDMRLPIEPAHNAEAHLPGNVWILNLALIPVAFMAAEGVSPVASQLKLSQG